MFGYLQIQKSELLVREFDAYKSVYCGLCKQLGKDYSFPARFVLSYDATFFAMLLMSAERSCSGFGDGRCTCNPLKKCKFALCSSDSYSKAAAFSIISSYYKIKDDILDNGFVKRNLYRLLLPVFSHWRKKAAKRYPDTDRLVSKMMDMQYEAEHSESSSVDSAAHPTAVMLADLFSSEAENDTDKRVYREFGYHLGRWIYLIDAADDMKKDKKAGSFNPFLNMQNNADADPKFISAVLNQSLARAYDAYNLIEIVDFKGILDNMMLKGLPTVQNRVISKLYTEGKDE